MQVKFSALMAAYAATFLLLLLAALDQTLWHGALSHALPRTPDDVFLYALIFVVPHVVASFFSFADKEYALFYRRRLLIELPLLLLATLVLYRLAPTLALLAYILYTEYHVASQQAGIGRFYFKAKLPEFPYWKWIILAMNTLGYGLIYSGSLFPERFANIAWDALLLLAALLAFATYRMLRRIESPLGRVYLLVVSVGSFAGVVLLTLGYPLFAVLGTRIAHDVPAFLAYFAHDANRQREAGGNILYRALASLHIPLALAIPVLAIVIAYGIASVPVAGVPLVLLVTVGHYYLEGFIWKSGSPHRRYIRFV